MLAAADRWSWPTVFAETLGAEGSCVGERSSSQIAEKAGDAQKSKPAWINTVWHAFDVGWLRGVKCRCCPVNL
jgi:hypothetical protein